jgi:hypothetical protein
MDCDPGTPTHLRKRQSKSAVADFEINSAHPVSQRDSPLACHRQRALRYGQLNGKLDYDSLQQIWRRTRGEDQTLLEAHQAKFDVLEIAPFRTADDPLEDQAEGAGSRFYLVNTNIRNDQADDADMLSGKKVAAYFDPWKYKIMRIRRGDVVFLYRSGSGVVAFGKADGKLMKTAYHGDPKHADEEFYMKLTGFTLVVPPMSAPELKEISGKLTMVFLQTMISLDLEGGTKVHKALIERTKKMPVPHGHPPHDAVLL